MQRFMIERNSSLIRPNKKKKTNNDDKEIAFGRRLTNRKEVKDHLL